VTTQEAQMELPPDAAAELNTQLTRALGSPPMPSSGVRPTPSFTWNYEVNKVSGPGKVQGTAWVFLADGHHQITAPLIASDGFFPEPSDLLQWSMLWNEHDDRGHHWANDLNEAGRDFIILGYHDRMASILDNAQIARECIRQTIAEGTDTPLTVGGFSMGGLITRYTLALMEDEKEDHKTSTYFSYDTPHRGGWIPISLQAFAHFLAGLNPLLSGMSNMIKSPAGRQMLSYYIDTHLSPPRNAPAHQGRTDFLAELDRVGSFPLTTKKIGVANGRADGVGLDVDHLAPDNVTLKWTPKQDHLAGATLYLQAPGTGHLVATLKKLAWPNQDPPPDLIEVYTDHVPALDGAPGGIQGTNYLAADTLKKAGFDASTDFPYVCFVPTVSAADVAEPGDPAAAEPIPDKPPAECGLDAYKCQPPSEDIRLHEHTFVTKELSDWIMDNLA